MKFLAYYVSVVIIFPFIKYRTTESNECIFHGPERKLPNVPITCNVIMEFLIYCDGVVNIYLCWVKFSIIYCGGYCCDTLNVCEKLRYVKIDWFCAVQIGYSPIKTGRN